MSNKQIYRQAKMRRQDTTLRPCKGCGGLGGGQEECNRCTGDGVEPAASWIDVSWIPAKLAKVGKTLTIDTKAEGERDGWVVLEVWGSREDSEVKLQTEAQREFAKKLDKKNHRDKE